MEYVIAADVGATNLRVALFTSEGLMLKTARSETPRSGGTEAVALKIVELSRKLMNELGVNKLQGVGVGSIGPLDIRRGDVIGTPNNPLRNFRLRKPLTELLNAPTYVVNDCVAAVWGEYKAGAGKGHENVVYVTISSGIGAGAIVDGHLLLGKDGNAHEVGHIVMDYRGRFRCGCGGLGHWEGMASGGNLRGVAAVLARDWEGRRTKAYELALNNSLRPADLFNLWRMGDEFAVHIINELTRINAAGIASVINVYDPEVLTVGGSVALRNPDFMERVFNNVDKYLINRKPEVMRLTPLGDDAVLIGAAWIAIDTPKHLLKIQSR